jgi:hypothetical protein
MKFDRIEAADDALVDFERRFLPYDAGFLAGKAFLAYRRRGGAKRSLMPDFYVGAHAVVESMRLLTRGPCPLSNVLSSARDPCAGESMICYSWPDGDDPCELATTR